jgi:hypothetical protein
VLKLDRAMPYEKELLQLQEDAHHLDEICCSVCNSTEGEKGKIIFCEGGHEHTKDSAFHLVLSRWGLCQIKSKQPTTKNTDKK